jgi:protein-S-isoprenylcysteine O-methyltransferase Ste14
MVQLLRNDRDKIDFGGRQLWSIANNRNEDDRVKSFNITVGNFFFRYRNALFPTIFVLASLGLRPHVIFGSTTLDRILGVAGTAIALFGESVRLITIGFEYIHRGGKDGQVYAGRLVRGGMYGLTRNPMYVGNGLIGIGMTMLLGSPLGYLILIPFFLFIYQAIISAEEAYLRAKFSSEYDDYASSVNRVIPSLSRMTEAFQNMRFDWRLSIQKDLGTIASLTIGMIIIPVWRSYFLNGWQTTQPAALRALGIVLGITMIYLILLKLKRSKRLFHWSYALSLASLAQV